MAQRPTPPRPDQVRTPPSAFGWLEAHLLHEGWLARLGPDATAVLVLLALAADRRGASFFGRARMALMLGLDRESVDTALDRLLELGLVVQRPWRPGHRDGVWQLVPVPSQSDVTRDIERARGPSTAAELVGRLGLRRPDSARRECADSDLRNPADLSRRSGPRNPALCRAPDYVE